MTLEWSLARVHPEMVSQVAAFLEEALAIARTTLVVLLRVLCFQIHGHDRPMPVPRHSGEGTGHYIGDLPDALAGI